MRELNDQVFKAFFKEEVESRRLPPLEIPNGKPSFWRAAGRFMGQVAAAAACIGLLWTVVLHRPEHPLDRSVSIEQTRQFRQQIVEQGGFIVEASLLENRN